MRIDIEKFAETYIREAFRLSKKNPSLNSFDNNIRAFVSKKLKLSKNFVGHLHHAFHWEFFCNNNSLLEYVQAHVPGETNSVKLKSLYKERDIQNLKELILDKYKTYLDSRVSSYVNPVRKKAG
ncbi:MAG: hypothetical protein WCX73_03380 [Candidatus Pacearchaeota archaeon]|jgi:hypothetical protein